VAIERNTSKVSPVKQGLSVFGFSVRIKYIFLALLAFCFYANSLSNEYALDDEAVIQKNDYVQKGIAGIGKILTSDAYDCYYKQNNANQHLTGGRYRPLSIALFAVEHQFFGESVTARHFINILLYVLCSLAIFYFLQHILLRTHPQGKDIAFLAPIFFIIHPIHTEVVANIKSSDEILSLLFILLVLIFSIKYREIKKPAYLFIGLLSLLLALLAKEYALTLVVLLPLLFGLYFKEGYRKSISKSLPYFGIVILYFILRFAAVGFPHQEKELDILNNPYLLATPLQKIATEIYIVGKYLWMLFFPYPLASDYGYAQIPYRSFSSPLVWLSILAYLAIVYGSIKLWRMRSILAFPFFFFLLNLFMVSNFLLNIGTTMGERLVFHSSFGFTVLLAWAIFYSTKNLKLVQRKPIIISLTCLLVIVTGAETIARNKDWKNNFTLFTKDVNTVPNSVKANDNAGAWYINLAEQTPDTLQSNAIVCKGLIYLHKSIKLDSTDVNAYLNLGIAYSKLINPDSAKYYWDIAKRLFPADPLLPGFYKLLGQIFLYTGDRYAMQGKPYNAISQLENGIRCVPGNADLWFNLGGAFFNIARYDSARYAWTKTAQLNPSYPDLNKWMGMLPK